MTLCDVAFLKGIHVTNYATGCIYEYDSTHTMENGVGFKEEDTPNFLGSFYSKTKAMVESVSETFSNLKNLFFHHLIIPYVYSIFFKTKVIDQLS